jgi:hypothetical protein
VTVWLVSSFGLALLISFPIFYVVLFFLVLSLFLAFSYCSVYKAFHGKFDIRDLVKNLLSEIQLLVVRTFDDFRIVSARVGEWCLCKESQVQEEMPRSTSREAQVQEEMPRSTIENLERRRSKDVQLNHWLAFQNKIKRVLKTFL